MKKKEKIFYKFNRSKIYLGDSIIYQNCCKNKYDPVHYGIVTFEPVVGSLCIVEIQECGTPLYRYISGIQYVKKIDNIKLAKEIAERKSKANRKTLLKYLDKK